MKLSRKVNFILFPVIGLMFSVAGTYAYVKQKATIIESVSERLMYESDYIAKDLQKSLMELDGVTKLLLNSSELLGYLNNQHLSVLNSSIEHQLLKYIQNLELSYGGIRTLDVFLHNGQSAFHFDLKDPFSEPSLSHEVKNHIDRFNRQLKPSGLSQILPVSYLLKNRGEGSIVLSVLRTFSPEHILYEHTFSKSMTFYTSAIHSVVDVNKRYRETLKTRFCENIKLSINPSQNAELDWNQVNHQLRKEKGASVSVVSNWQGGTITLSTPPEYVQKEMLPYRNAILALSIAVSFVTFVILRVLIGRLIIRPISSLTSDVERAVTGDSLKLRKVEGAGEVAVLNNRYIDLFAELSKMAKFDNLTGLANRYLFNSSMSRVVAQTLKDEKRCALLYIDLDNFKSVNDNYGHHIGDKVLKHFAERLMDSFRSTDVVGAIGCSEFSISRLAGDEFAILLSDLPNSDIVAKIAKRITDICRNGLTVDDISFDVRVSLGIAVCPDDADTAESLLVKADSAMYQVKRTGKNGFHFYSKALDDELKYHADIETELKHVIDNELFSLVYMPIYDCRTGKLAGAETLLRASSDLLQKCGPAEFIPIAEATGLIEAIDYWVLEKSIQQLKTLIDSYAFTGVISVNFSAWQLQNDQFAEYVSSLIEKYRIPPEQLALEITETCFVTSKARNSGVLAALRLLGINLALDDFGTGYTAFNQLMDFPVTALKVDRAFLKAISNKAEGERLLVDIVIELARLYELKVIAEGVETNEQLEYIRKAGCDYAQGYLLSKPVAWDGFLSLIKQH